MIVNYFFVYVIKINENTLSILKYYFSWQINLAHQTSYLRIEKQVYFSRAVFIWNPK